MAERSIETTEKEANDLLIISNNIFDNATKFLKHLSITVSYGNNLMKSYSKFQDFILTDETENFTYGKEIASAIDHQRNILLAVELYSKKFSDLMTSNYSESLKEWKTSFLIYSKNFKKDSKPLHKKLEKRYQKIENLINSLKQNPSEKKKTELVLKYKNSVTKLESMQTKMENYENVYMDSIQLVMNNMLQKNNFVIAETFMYQGIILRSMKDSELTFKKLADYQIKDTKESISVRNIEEHLESLRSMNEYYDKPEGCNLFVNNIPLHVSESEEEDENDDDNEEEGGEDYETE